MKQPAVYIMAIRRNGTLYTGVTSDLPRRAYEHHAGVVPGFTSRYTCKLLVWYEVHDSVVAAIEREKQIKGGSRRSKLALIEASNAGLARLVRRFNMRQRLTFVMGSEVNQSKAASEARAEDWIASSLRSSQ